MYHSLIISGKNTFDEWGLVPTSRPLVNPPEIKTAYVDNPGGNGILDYTDNLTGAVLYGNRKGSWEFWVCPEDEWANVYSEVMNYIHGIKHAVILEDDPDYLYTGRLNINSWKSDKHNSILTIDYNLDPFKQSIHENEDWTWDDYFTKTITYRTIKIAAGSIRKIVMTNTTQMTIPTTYTASQNIVVNEIYHENTGETTNSPITLVSGINNNSLLYLNPGVNEFSFDNSMNLSTTNITLRYREVSL